MLLGKAAMDPDSIPGRAPVSMTGSSVPPPPSEQKVASVQESGGQEGQAVTTALQSRLPCSVLHLHLEEAAEQASEPELPINPPPTPPTAIRPNSRGR